MHCSANAVLALLLRLLLLLFAAQGYNPRWEVSASAVWCNASLHAPGIKPRNCTEMRVLTCVKKPPLETRQIAGALV
jgi:hypothetical protein